MKEYTGRPGYTPTAAEIRHHHEILSRQNRTAESEAESSSNLRGVKMFRPGLSFVGWAMILLEIIPAFVYFSLVHFHLNYDKLNHANVTYWMDFYVIIVTIPVILIIAVLSDGYVYGKLISTVTVLLLTSITSFCTVLATSTWVELETRRTLMNVSLIGILLYHVATPIRMTIFADLVSHGKNHANARKCYTYYWVFVFTGAVLGLNLFKYLLSLNDDVTTSSLAKSVLYMTILYIVGSCSIAMSLPLELPIRNLFIYHMQCFCFALRNQKLCKGWKPKTAGLWLDVASKKYTLTEVKRTKSIYFLILFSLPVACYFNTLVLLYYYWYSHRFIFVLAGHFTDDYTFFYVDVLMASLFSLIIQFIVLPVVAYLTPKNIKEGYILLTGYLFLGIALLMLLITELRCHRGFTESSVEKGASSAVRIINGYPYTIAVSSKWVNQDGEKDLAVINAGDAFTMVMKNDAAGTFEEAAIFAESEYILKDLLALEMEKGKFVNYYVREGGHDRFILEEEASQQPADMLFWSKSNFLSTVLVLCSSDFWNTDQVLDCYFNEEEDIVNGTHIREKPMCEFQRDFERGPSELNARPTVIRLIPRTYKCSTNDGLAHELELNPRDIILLYYIKASEVSSTDRILGAAYESRRGNAFVRTHLEEQLCIMEWPLLLTQIMIHSLSLSCLLVGASTIVCLYGPPRLRMISFALLYSGIYLGVFILRASILASTNHGWLFLSSVHSFIYIIGLLLLLYAVFCIPFQVHSWEESWRASACYKLWNAIRTKLLYGDMDSDKRTKFRSFEGDTKEKSILQSEVDKDRRREDEKNRKKVLFTRGDDLYSKDSDILESTNTNDPTSNDQPGQPSTSKNRP